MERCIVAPVDGSSFGEHALPLAATLAKRLGAVLHIAHVHVPLIAPSGVEVVAFRGSWNDVAKEQERGYLEGLVDRVSSRYGIRVDAETLWSTVPGLFAAGECAAGLHGATRLGGTSLSALLACGKRAACSGCRRT